MVCLHVARGKLQSSRVNFNNAKPVVVDVKTHELSYEARWVEDLPFPYPDVVHDAYATGEIRLLIAYAVRIVELSVCLHSRDVAGSMRRSVLWVLQKDDWALSGGAVTISTNVYGRYFWCTVRLCPRLRSIAGLTSESDSAAIVCERSCCARSGRKEFGSKCTRRRHFQRLLRCF
jgi:hypothetical protein